MINLREWALPVYTIMMQMAAGTMLMLWIVYTGAARRHGKPVADRLSHNLVMIILVTVIAAMIGSHYHLSRPFFSILAVMNLESSWLSREVFFTVVFAALVGGLWLLQRLRIGPPLAHLIVGWGAVIMGIITVYCMSHVYLLPTQAAWNSLVTPVTFFSAAFLLGTLALSALLLINLYLGELRQAPGLEIQRQIIERVLWWVVLVTAVVALVELVVYIVQINQLAGGDSTARASLELLLGLYHVLFAIRLGLLGLGVATLAGGILWQRRMGLPVVRLLTPVYIAFLFVLVGEVLGRFLFYAIHVRTGI